MDYLLRGTAAQSLLLQAAPAVRLVGGADWRGSSQILTHVKEITQEVSLIAKDFLGLESNPVGPIGDHMNAAV